MPPTPAVTRGQSQATATPGCSTQVDARGLDLAVAAQHREQRGSETVQLPGFLQKLLLVLFIYLFFLAERSQQLQTERGIKENKWAGAEREKPGYGRICQAPYRHVAIAQQPVIPGNGRGAQTGCWWWWKGGVGVGRAGSVPHRGRCCAVG